jgi:hypothetical protein
MTSLIAPEEAGFALWGIGREPDNAGGAFLDRAWGSGAAHLGAAPPWAY